MFSPVAVFLFVTTLAELFVLTQVGGVLGAFPTILLLLGLSGLGIFVLRTRGAGFVAATIAKVSGNQSEVADTLANQALILFGCLLLIIPGFVSAAMAILLFVPPIRALVRPVVRSRVQAWTLPYQRFGRSYVDVESTVVNDGVVDVDSVAKDAHPRAPRELG